jgi:hypothetical protein
MDDTNPPAAAPPAATPSDTLRDMVARWQFFDSDHDGSALGHRLASSLVVAGPRVVAVIVAVQLADGSADATVSASQAVALHDGVERWGPVVLQLSVPGLPYAGLGELGRAFRRVRHAAAVMEARVGREAV